MIGPHPAVAKIKSEVKPNCVIEQAKPLASCRNHPAVNVQMDNRSLMYSITQLYSKLGASQHNYRRFSFFHADPDLVEQILIMKEGYTRKQVMNGMIVLPEPKSGYETMNRRWH